MEKTLILLKPCTVQRRLIGEVINRIERKGLRIVGLKMMQLDDAIENYIIKNPKIKVYFVKLFYRTRCYYVAFSANGGQNDVALLNRSVDGNR